MSSGHGTQPSIGPVARLGLAALAVWRVSHLIALEDGPFDVVARARRRVGDGAVGRLIDCFACTSVWVAAPAAVALRPRRSSDLVLTWLGLSGAACVLQRWPGEVPEVHLLDEGPEVDGML